MPRPLRRLAVGDHAATNHRGRRQSLFQPLHDPLARGGFPNTEEGLKTLPGIGPYTAAAVASIAFDRAAPVMDGNVERVMARLFAVTDPLPASKPTLYAHAAKLTPNKRPGDYAQAVMDLGATICTPKSPSCLLCPLKPQCRGNAQGIAQNLPFKTPKPEKPHRTGHAYVAIRQDGAILLETRPEKGLLGGMKGFPGSNWSETPPPPNPPLKADWITSPKEVTHVFTHFKLTLNVHVARIAQNTTPPLGAFTDANSFNSKDLPTVMRKVFDKAIQTIGEHADA